MAPNDASNDPGRESERRRLDPAASRAAWRGARTFDDLCELGRRFVAGELTFFPGWNAPDLDTESDAIARELVDLHRRGFLTVASQPAAREQHAFVCGFVSPTTGARLAPLDGADELVVAVFGAGVGRESRGAHAHLGAIPSGGFPVSFHGGVAHAFAGHDARADELECFEDHVSVEALDALRAAAWVSAFDTRLGRVDVLWNALRRALEVA